MESLSKPLNILIDSDVLCFRASLAGEETTKWSEAYTDDQGIFHEAIVTTTYNLDKSKATLDRSVRTIVAAVLKHMKHKEKYNVIHCLSAKVNFRKALYTEYKAQRPKEKPKLYKAIREYCESCYPFECWDNLEADDTIAVLGTTLENPVICSIDKDFRTVPNVTFYDIDKGTFESTTPESAQWFHYYQCLLGDSTDNYKGCRGIGKVRAKNALDEDCSWDTVRNLYLSKGHTEEEALLNARLAKILTADLYNRETGEITLWNPGIL